MGVIIKGLDKAQVLMALYEHASPQGMGILHYDATPMASDEAQAFIESRRHKLASGNESIYFDYLKGRVMKVQLGGDELETSLYNRDNGREAAERALAPLLIAQEMQEKGLTLDMDKVSHEKGNLEA